MKDIFDDMAFSNLNNHPGEPLDDSLSIREHEELRLLLAGAKAAFADEDGIVLPNPQIHKNLRAIVAARKKPVIHKWRIFPAINISGILNFKVPAYQVGFAMIVVLFSAILLGRNSGLNGNKNTVIVYKTDTVYEKMQKKAGATSISKDSQALILTPSYSGGLFADSIDINGVGNNNTMQNQALPAGEKSSPGNFNGVPAVHKIQSPSIIDTPDKGSSRIEDTSKWNRQLRG